MKNELFYTWGNDKQKADAFNKTYEKIIESQASSHYSKASDIFKDIDTNISVTDGFSRRDYEYFRQDEAIANDHKGIKSQCRKVYRKVGLVRNIVDLMADFTVQGMRIVHPVESIQKFFETWADKVNMVNRAERQATNLIHQGCYAIHRISAKLNQEDVDNFKKNMVLASDLTNFKVDKNTIPWKYKMLNPATLDVIGDDLAILSDSIIYGVNIPQTLITRIKTPKTDVDKKLVASIPKEWVNGIREGQKVIPLDPNKNIVDHYKKDDYELWADPMIYAVLDDIIMLRKMKLADISALDGALSRVRLWRLGSLEHKIIPNPAVLSKLSNILINNVSGGCIDLVWGPELDFKETSSDVQSFLGSAKYEPVLNAIYAGLGIPPTLTGGGGQGGFTNNSISLKTLLERLNYIRGIIVNFWQNELRIIQKAMGFAKSAWIEFDKTTLTDEAAEKRLILDMVDRDIISIETARERLKENPELEILRIKKEERRRKKRKLPPKVGPYHDANHEKNLQKIALQGGIATPSQVGLTLEEKTKGEKTILEMQQKNQKESQLPGVAGEGRPTGKKDIRKRKKKRVLPRAAAALTVAYSWARSAQSQIADYLDKVFVKSLNKENLRQLSNEEAKDLENLKFAVLCSLTPNTEIDESVIEAALETELSIPISVEALCQTTVAAYKQKYNKDMTLDEIRQTKAMSYAMLKGDF